jgi:hypothetical protein
VSFFSCAGVRDKARSDFAPSGWPSGTTCGTLPPPRYGCFRLRALSHCRHPDRRGLRGRRSRRVCAHAEPGGTDSRPLDGPRGRRPHRLFCLVSRYRPACQASVDIANENWTSGMRTYTRQFNSTLVVGPVKGDVGRKPAGKILLIPPGRFFPGGHANDVANVYGLLRRPPRRLYGGAARATSASGGG